MAVSIACKRVRKKSMAINPTKLVLTNSRPGAMPAYGAQRICLRFN